jgi:large subunit ribosomal protein LP0
MQEIKDKVEEFRQPAAARANAVAQCDVDIAAGPTSLDPSQTSFFQALGISTKIQKGKSTNFCGVLCHLVECMWTPV